jgi:hypothetical protein
MARYDLHSHSTFSDGLLSPAAMVARAAARGVEVYALTDHDDIGGLDEARAAADEADLAFVPGAELSVSWQGITLHVVGLGFDAGDDALADGLAAIRAGRSQRGRRIGEALAAAGIEGAYEGALRFVTSERLISRTHFARFLVEAGHVASVRDVFKRYLVRGKPGYVPHEWATLAQAIGWIHGAGGQAILAHPGRYKLDSSGMRRLLAEFRDTGGDAIEVLSSSHTREQFARFAALARSYGLRASCGSDYHGPGESVVDLGDLPDLPAGVIPVWSAW